MAGKVGAQMSFGAAVRSGLGKFTVFSGRARRSEFWKFFLAVGVAFGCLSVIVPILYRAAPADGLQENASSWIVPLVVTGYVGLIMSTVAALVRRLHDTGHGGAWVLLPLVFGPFGFIPLLVFACQDSRPDNEYGPSPKSENRPAQVAMSG
jgi:uncharacterized membrane protein YhaH (DUF805 family)